MDIIDEKALSIAQILKYRSYKWMTENKLQRSLDLHWNGAPIKMLKDVFPNKLHQKQLTK